MEDFAPFKLARKLKEKGYPQVKKNTLAMYNEEGEWFSLAANLDDYEYAFEDFDDRDCVCPTISQVLKWLRKDKQLHVSIDLMCDYSEDADGNIREEWTYWSYSVHHIKEGPIYRDFNQLDHIEYESFKEAAIKGIEHVLDNLI